MHHLLMGNSLAGQFFQVVPITCLAAAVYTVIRYGWMKKRKQSIRWGAEAARLLFACYLTGLINLVLVPNNFWTAIWFYLFNGYPGTTVGPMFTLEWNLVPTVYLMMTGEYTTGSWVITMLIGNALMFVPMGVFLPLIFQKINGRNIVPVAIAIPLAVELLQPIVGRSVDIDDLLLNFIGILIGWLAAVLIQTMVKKEP